MNMQDKEFDELFRSKMEDLEVEPSNGLWDNIAAEVVIDRKNRSALPFISIAASVLVLVTAGVFFIPKLKQDNVKPAVAVVVKHVDNPEINVAPAQIKNADTEPRSVQIAAVAVAPKVHRTKQSFKKQTGSLPAVKVEEANNTPQQIAQGTPTTAPQNDAILAAVKPGMAAPAIAALQINDEVKVSPVATLAEQVPAKTIAAAQPKKRRIRSFGDLINVVVSKVDKRKDKLIEFSSKDDDESLITGINLGIIKVKKEEVIATNK
ncbi:hypothetical protein IDJ77_20100 [Mucilaginibacter sp. ZT4R22]|uniref:Uncharacterized protein n=1 Tax=Mucilaginibacter pankratovii TaxID=2772110 RepID=A0ABR7WXG4_9SPHI|nr:hypothetical protein [Mucilaginibacter pankratovii]MBD1366124.1 hypothetical protein [Mucilaginibacter pankratovii]